MEIQNNQAKVIIESPYAGDIAVNQAYLIECIRDSIINHGEAPFASHGLYTAALRDDDPIERALGINRGFRWRHVADYTVAYIDLGVSNGMKAGLKHATAIGQRIVHRRLGGKWSSQFLKSIA